LNSRPPKTDLALGYPFGFIVLICIHTGLRRGEAQIVADEVWDRVFAPFFAMSLGMVMFSGVMSDHFSDPDQRFIR
jgi:hypothetical protein